MTLLDDHGAFLVSHAGLRSEQVQKLSHKLGKVVVVLGKFDFHVLVLVVCSYEILANGNGGQDLQVQLDSLKRDI